jgi:uncharacterized SAM-binding protein YcdF (DUF218 family)
MRGVFFALSKILDLFLSPLTWGLLLLVAAPMSRHRRGLSDLFTVSSILVLSLFSAEPVARRLMRVAEASAPTTVRSDLVYDAVIVLGGGIDPAASRATGAPRLNAAADRIVRTIGVLRSGRARNALLAGGLVHPQPGEPSEAERTALLLREWGIAPERIYLETRSRNTHENAVESARIAMAQGWHTLLLVTSAAHMARALESFRAAGVEPDALPVDFRAGDGFGENWAPRTEFLDMSTYALRELAGRLVYRLAGYAKP